MRLLFFSDLHVHAWSSPYCSPEERLHDCVSVLSDVRRYALDNGVQHVFFGGDMFHQRGVLYTRPYSMVALELLKFQEAGITFYAVDGNHDHEDRLGEMHAMQPLTAGGLVVGVPRSGWVNVWPDDHVCVSMFSYCDSLEAFRDRIEQATAAYNTDLGDDVYHVGLFHHGFKGARVGTSLEYVVKEEIDAVNLAHLYDVVFSGHYHTHQPIPGLDNGWYIGSPLQHMRSDSEDEAATQKGFIVLDTDKSEWFIETLQRPRFERLDAHDIVKYGADADVVQGNFIDLLYSDHDELAEASALVLALDPRGMHPVPHGEIQADDDETRLDVSPLAEPRTVLRSYVAHKQPPHDIEDLVGIGLDIVRAALEKKT